MKVEIFLEPVEKSTVGSILSYSDLALAAAPKTSHAVGPSCSVYGKNKDDLNLLVGELDDYDAGFVDVHNTEFFTLSVDTTVEVVEKIIVDLFNLNLKIE